MKNKNIKYYLLGILCVIPLIGIFIGVMLIFIGVKKLKDKVLIGIGIGGLFISLLPFGIFFYEIEFGHSFDNLDNELTVMVLNNVVKTISVYKDNEGIYPDNLVILKRFDSSIQIVDPLSIKTDTSYNFEYFRTEHGFVLFSRGKDHKPYTKDDIYPSIKLRGDSLASPSL